MEQPIAATATQEPSDSHPTRQNETLEEIRSALRRVQGEMAQIAKPYDIPSVEAMRKLSYGMLQAIESPLLNAERLLSSHATASSNASGSAEGEESKRWENLDGITIRFGDGKTVQILERLVTQTIVERHNAELSGSPKPALSPAAAEELLKDRERLQKLLEYLPNQWKAFLEEKEPEQ